MRWKVIIYFRSSLHLEEDDENIFSNILQNIKIFLITGSSCFILFFRNKFKSYEELNTTIYLLSPLPASQTQLSDILRSIYFFILLTAHCFQSMGLSFPWPLCELGLSFICTQHTAWHILGSHYVFADQIHRIL